MIRLLADRKLVDDAFRAYAYFRWVHDYLDQDGSSRAERLAFVERQRALMDWSIASDELPSQAYRNWVEDTAKEARACFQAGRHYLARVEDSRCRIAGYAYIHRFEVVLDCIERERYLLRAEYPEQNGNLRGMAMISWALWMALCCRRKGGGLKGSDAR